MVLESVAEASHRNVVEDFFMLLLTGTCPSPIKLQPICICFNQGLQNLYEFMQKSHYCYIMSILIPTNLHHLPGNAIQLCVGKGAIWQISRETISQRLSSPSVWVLAICNYSRGPAARSRIWRDHVHRMSIHCCGSWISSIMGQGSCAALSHHCSPIQGQQACRYWALGLRRIIWCVWHIWQPITPFCSHSVLFDNHPVTSQALGCCPLRIMFKQHFQHQLVLSHHA